MAKIFTLQNHQDHRRYLDMLRAEFQMKYTSTKTCDKKVEDYDQIKAIGNGAYGEVFLVRDKSTFTYHAMKAVDKAIVVERKHVKHLLLEKKILESIQYPFVITLDAAFKDNVYLYFILPYIAGGELFNIVQKYGCLSNTLAKFYAAQILLALEYLHHCEVVHRDLKPENVLITANGYLKLVDYGFCKVVKKKTWTLCGTPEYLAPEIILSKGYSFPVDWWAFGVLIFEMLAGYPPFFAPEPNKLYNKILEGHFKYPDNMVNECKNLIKGLLQVDSAKRLGTGAKGAGIFDLKSHPWFGDVPWSQILGQKMEAPLVPVVESPGDTSNFPEFDQQKLKKSSTCLYVEEFESF